MTDQEAIRLYNKFPPEKRNMTRAEFIKQYKDLTSQEGIERDVARILHGRSQQRVIDSVIRGQDG